MDNQEAIMRIKEHIRIHQICEPRAIKISEALDMAISALKAQLAHTNTPNALDCVERYVAIDTVKNMRKVCDTNDINESHKEDE